MREMYGRRFWQVQFDWESGRGFLGGILTGDIWGTGLRGKLRDPVTY